MVVMFTKFGLNISDEGHFVGLCHETAVVFRLLILIAFNQYVAVVC